MSRLPLSLSLRLLLVMSVFSFAAFRAIASEVTIATPWLIPVEGVSRGELIDNFGEWRDGGRRHQGIDIFAPRGTPVMAATDGMVAARRQTPNGGRVVYLMSADGYTFYYAHLDRWAAGLSEGKSVRRGQVLGYVGNSGNAARSRCHLHFEIQENGRTRNPYLLLRKRTHDGQRLMARNVSASTRSDIRR